MTEPAPWTLLFNRVKASLPGATDALIRQEIGAVLMDFTQDTNLWIEEIPFVAIDNTLNYPLTLTGGTANRLMCVYDPENDPPHWYMHGVSMQVPAVIHFVRQPEPGQDLVATIAKAASTPAMDTSVPPKPTGYPEIDAWIVEKYADVLYYGTLSYLQLEPVKTFSDPRLGTANGARYQSGKSQARVEAQRANIYGGQSWIFPQNWATISRKGWG
jgi:hypothetical protein